MFKIKDGYKLEIQTPETIILFGSTKRLIDKTKNGENVLNLDVVEVFLVNCNLVDHQYQKSLMFHKLLHLINLMFTFYLYVYV